jgi:transposase
VSRYIGLDVHSTSCTMIVLGSDGKRLGRHVVETNASVLIDLIKTIPKPRHLCFEEGTQSAWLHEVLSPHVDQIVVTVKTERRGPKDDELDAHKLADALRTNSIEVSVFKHIGRYSKLKQLARVYQMQVSDSVRTQNRIRAMFRARGIQCNATIYDPKRRDDWLDKLPVAFRQPTRLLLREYDAVETLRSQAEKAMVSEARKHPICQVLQTVPGLGAIRTAEIVPIVIDPHRFRTRRQFWSYSGLGIVMRSSSDWVQNKTGGWQREAVQHTRGLNRNRNATLKFVFKGAAKSIIMRADESSPLYQHYQAMLNNKIKPNLATLTLARQVAAITLSVWKTQEAFDQTRLTKRK